MNGVLDEASWEEADRVIAGFESAGVDIEDLGASLQSDGAESFVEAWKHLLETIESKIGNLQST